MASPLGQPTSRCLSQFHLSVSLRCAKPRHVRGLASRPPQAPRVAIDVKSIRENPALHSQNCVDRNYGALATFPQKINLLFQRWKESEEAAKALRQRAKILQASLSSKKRLPEPEAACTSENELLEEARALKEELHKIETSSASLQDEIQYLAESLPNITSPETPTGSVPVVLGYINQESGSALTSQANEVSHVDIGKDLNLLDFSAASTVSGWGWYYLKNEAALLEQALVQYALGVAMRHGFQPTSPPSVVYSHIGAACGFQPRDQGGEQQVYTLHQDDEDKRRSKPELSLSGTAEIPFAGLLANSDLSMQSLPLTMVGSSRCYRAEAGSRGVNTKGLYRVHEFTKVEMFGWTMPDADATQATRLFHQMVAVQTEILQNLGLYCRVLEQPSADLGASATRKQDIEAFFPSRRDRDAGWGEVTSASICTDYQTRRLATRVKNDKIGGRLEFPHTVNGTAVAVPRVLAALLETYWEASEGCVRVPEVLWPWMHGVKVIRKKGSTEPRTV